MIWELNFKGKTAVITGAASGIGLLTAQCLAKDGANVVMVDVNEQALNEKVQELTAAGCSAIGALCDVRNYEEVNKVCDKAVDTFGSLDIMVNCAGGTAVRMLKCDKPNLEVPIEVYDWGIDVNLKGPFYFGYAAMKKMAAQKSGVIINLGSVTGEEGDQRGMDYAVSKSGVMYGLTKSLAELGANHGVRCCCVSPGPVLTRPEMSNMHTLLKRAGEPQEIVDMILYLASDKAAFITGTNYFVDGGRVILKMKGWGEYK